MSEPTFYHNWGKPSKDLFKKEYELKNQMNVEIKPNPDLKLEFVVSVPIKKRLEGLAKLKHDSNNWVVEGNIRTNGDVDAEVKYKKLYDGLTVLAKLDGANVKGGAEYRYKKFGVTANALYGIETQAVTAEGSLTYRQDRVECGGIAKYNIKDRVLDDYNIGLQYHSNFLFSVETVRKAEQLNMSYHQKVNNDRTQLGAKVESQLNALNNSILSIAAIHNLNKSTTVRAKFDTKGSLASVIEYRLPGQNFTLVLGAQFSPLKTGFPDKFGVSLKFHP